MEDDRQITTSRFEVPTLPGSPGPSAPAERRDGLEGRDLAKSRTGTFRRMGYAGLMPAMLAATPEPALGSRRRTPAADADRSDVDEPTLGGAGPVASPALAPTRVIDQAAAAEAADDDAGATTDIETDAAGGAAPAPVNPLTGLPTRPTGPVTETPKWAKRRTKLRVAVSALFVVLLIGTLAAVVVASIQSFTSSGGPSDDGDTGESVAADPDTGDDPIDDVTPGDANGVRPQVATLLSELQVERADQVAAADRVESYWFTWTDPFGFEVTAGVDAATGDFTATTKPNTEIRRVAGRYYGRVQNGPWIVLSAEAGAAIPAPLFEGPLIADDVVPADVVDYVVAEEDLLYDQRALLVDEARLAAEDPAAHVRWLTPWGLLPDADVPEPTERAERGIPPSPGPGDVRMVVRTRPSGVVEALSLASRSIGGSATYVLLETHDAPLHVAAPTLD